MEIVMATCAGLGLAAACGLRVFLPLLVASVAARMGHIDPSGGMEWIGSWPAVITFGTATLLEVGGYYVPWLDNLLDTVASPAAVAAGTVAAAGAFGDIDPAIKWSAALVAGGGLAGVVQGTTVLTRALSSATTGGVGNSAVSTGENLGATLVSILAIVLPILTLILVLVGVVGLMRWVIRRRRRALAGDAGAGD